VTVAGRLDPLPIGRFHLVAGALAVALFGEETRGRTLEQISA